MRGLVLSLLFALALHMHTSCGQDLEHGQTWASEEMGHFLRNLWTVEFPRLLQENNSTFFTPGCMASALDIYTNPPGKMVTLPELGNVTLPGVRAYPLLDATGKPGPGLLTGNVVLEGAYDECFNYNYTGFCLAEGIKINASVFDASNMSLPLVWTVGFCVPKNCTPHDVAVLVNISGSFFTTEDTVTCSDSKSPSYSTGAIVMLLVCAVFILLVMAGTCVDGALTYIPKLLHGEKEVELDSGTSPINYGGLTDSDSEPLLKKSLVQRADIKADKVSPVEFITAFSLIKTVSTLLATKQAPGVITSLNGLRVISMFWVILGHTHFWVFTTSTVRVDNLATVFKVGSRFSFQGVLAGFFAVDSFFFLSGVLVAYLTFRQMKKKGGRFPFVNFYVHRFLRLTPTYAIVLFFAWTLTNHLAVGPSLNLKNPFADNCEKYWWTNLLYINNLYPWRLMDGCISWTWYLANDMQFYIISPLVLIPAYFLFPVGLVVAGVILVGGYIVTGALTIAYDYQANMFSLIAYNYTGDVTNYMSYQNSIYIKPWSRIAPYLVGLILGYVLFKGFKFAKLNRMLRLLSYVAMWCVAGFVMFWIAYGLYFTWHGHTPGLFENLLYILFSRTLWALSLSAIVFACHNGYGGYIDSLLSMNLWTPLSRMTFNAYLVHPIVMTTVYGQLQTTIHYTDITMAGYLITFVVLSYGVAAVVCVVVEFPLSRIEMLVFKICGSIGRKKHGKKHSDYEKLQDQPKAVDS